MRETIIVPGRQVGRTTSTVQQLVDAYVRARLTVPFEIAVADPALGKCLQNIVHANQADAARQVDLRTDGDTLIITPVRQPLSPTPAGGPRLDRMRLAAGDQDD